VRQNRRGEVDRDRARPGGRRYRVGAVVARFPAGVFRTTITDADLIAGHAPSEVQENHGTFTLTVGNGRFVLHQWAPNPLTNPTGSGVYTVTGNKILFTMKKPFELAGGRIKATWSYVGHTLRFKVPDGDPDYRVIFSAHPWRKVG
jgi:hypothetical protein